MFYKILVGVALFGHWGLAFAVPGEIIFVSQNATGYNDGSSWANAFSRLEDALEVSQDGDQVWVANGLYVPGISSLREPTRPVPMDPREISFKLKVGVRLYGGFRGYETAIEARVPPFDQTILSGERGDRQLKADNVHQILVADTNGGSPASAIVIDGFVVEGANSTVTGGGLTAADMTGPVYGPAYIDVANSVFRNNHAKNGGAIAITNHIGNIRNVRFENNSARLMGGALYQNGVGGLNKGVSESYFRKNTAGLDGGAIYRVAGAPTYHNHQIHNSTFAENCADRNGGAIFYDSHGSDEFIASKHLVLVNSLFSHNYASQGGAIFLGAGRRLDDHAAILPTGLTGIHLTMVENGARVGGGIYLEQAPEFPAFATLMNSIVWGNRSIESILHWHVYGGVAMISSDVEDFNTQGAKVSLVSERPLFVNARAMDYRLAFQNSFALFNAPMEVLPFDQFDLDQDGNTLEPVSLDLARRPRQTESHFLTMGAFEGSPSAGGL